MMYTTKFMWCVSFARLRMLDLDMCINGLAMKGLPDFHRIFHTSFAEIAAAARHQLLRVKRSCDALTIPLGIKETNRVDCLYASLILRARRGRRDEDDGTGADQTLSHLGTRWRCNCNLNKVISSLSSKIFKIHHLSKSLKYSVPGFKNGQPSMRFPASWNHPPNLSLSLTT